MGDHYHNMPGSGDWSPYWPTDQYPHAPAAPTRPSPPPPPQSPDQVALAGREQDMATNEDERTLFGPSTHSETRIYSDKEVAPPEPEEYDLYNPPDPFVDQDLDLPEDFMGLHRDPFPAHASFETAGPAPPMMPHRPAPGPPTGPDGDFYPYRPGATYAALSQPVLPHMSSPSLATEARRNVSLPPFGPPEPFTRPPPVPPPVLPTLTPTTAPWSFPPEVRSSQNPPTTAQSSFPPTTAQSLFPSEVPSSPSLQSPPTPPSRYRHSMSRGPFDDSSGAASVHTTNTTVDGGDSAGPKITIGLDYGTTHSGLAFATIGNHDGRDASTLDLKVFTQWPGKTGQKVPSLVSYSKTAKHRSQFGNDIDDKSEVVKWTKLDLDPKKVTDQLKQFENALKGLKLVNSLWDRKKDALARDIPFHIAKNSTEIVQDFLERMLQAWADHMEVTASGALANVPIDVVVTHPAKWSYRAKNKTLKAVRGAFEAAGIPPVRNIFLCSEPEACALYTAHEALRSGTGLPQVGHCFTVCDAGGGTVDLITYCVKSLQPFVIEQVGRTNSYECGAIFIDKEFFTWLSKILEPWDSDARGLGTGGHTVVQPQGRALIDRFQPIKHRFGKNTANGDRSTFQIDSTTLKVKKNDFAKEKVSDGVLEITDNDLSEMFEPCVQKVLDLLDQQVAAAKLEKKRVSHIYMSGGFAESEHLYQRVEEFAKQSRIRVTRAKDCWSAVAKGAVLKGAGIGTNPPVPVKMAEASYGYMAAKRVACLPNGVPVSSQKLESGRIAWLLKYGDLTPLPNEKPAVFDSVIDVELTHQQMTNGSQVEVKFIVSKRHANPPSLISEVNYDDEDIIRLTFPCSAVQVVPSSNAVQQENGLIKALVKVGIEVSSTKVDFIVSHGGKKLANHTMQLAAQRRT